MEALLGGSPLHQLGDGVENSKIPTPLLQLILENCRTKVSPEIAAEIAEATARPIMFYEFNSAIEKSKRDKAPGPSGLTSNMLKSLSLSARRYIHNAMSILWEEKHIPQWMKDRMMALIPKKNGSVSLGNLRPIGLLEVLRKVWAGIIVRRVQAIWEKHGCLHPSQHGYRWNNGTDHATFRAQDKVEQAKSTDSALFAALWDIRAAFHSVPRTLMKLAWRRLGLPEDVADWITSLDEGGLTFPATPHVLLNQELRESADMASCDGSFLLRKDLGFLSERRIIQG